MRALTLVWNNEQSLRVSSVAKEIICIISSQTNPKGITTSDGSSCGEDGRHLQKKKRKKKKSCGLRQNLSLEGNKTI